MRSRTFRGRNSAVSISPWPGDRRAAGDTVYAGTFTEPGEERGSVVAGGLRELALAHDGEGVYLSDGVNRNDADASEDPAKRASSSGSVSAPKDRRPSTAVVGSRQRSAGDELPAAQGGTASQVPHSSAPPVSPA